LKQYFLACCNHFLVAFKTERLNKFWTCSFVLWLGLESNFIIIKVWEVNKDCRVRCSVATNNWCRCFLLLHFLQVRISMNFHHNTTRFRHILVDRNTNVKTAVSRLCCNKNQPAPGVSSNGNKSTWCAGTWDGRSCWSIIYTIPIPVLHLDVNSSDSSALWHDVVRLYIC
jgi:hypothetical protein